MRNITGFILPLVTACAIASAAQAQGKYNITAAEQAACFNDAVHLCSSAYPNEDALLSCMKQNQSSLSVGCAVVFKAGLKRRHMS